MYICCQYTFYLYQFTIAGVIQIEFLEDSLTVNEGVNITIDIFVVILVPTGKQLGCDIEVVFTSQSGGIASEYNNDVYSTEEDVTITLILLFNITFSVCVKTAYNITMNFIIYKLTVS